VIYSALDVVFNPKDRWSLYSRAADLLTIARLRGTDGFDSAAEPLGILVKTENARLSQLVNLDELLSSVTGTSRPGIRTGQHSRR
jgi:hypothetical protein